MNTPTPGQEKCQLFHSCYCGMAKGTPHELGQNGCERSITASPDKFAADPETDSPMWLVDGQIVTEYTLIFQRGYHQHKCGCWSKSGPDDDSPH